MKIKLNIAVLAAVLAVGASAQEGACSNFPAEAISQPFLIPFFDQHEEQCGSIVTSDGWKMEQKVQEIARVGNFEQVPKPLMNRPMLTRKSVDVLPGERWWGAAVGRGFAQPFAVGEKMDLSVQSFNNQVVGLLLSNKGRYVWGERPFSFEFAEGRLEIIHMHGDVVVEVAGTTLRDAYRAASARYFPPTGKLPDPVFFEKPQWNTWIELQYNQNQADILEYARNIVAQGLPAGILMIDDSWQTDFGVWKFRPERFPDPKGMVKELHELGFKVMLWVCPFVSADSAEYRDLVERKLLVLNHEGNSPAVIEWWNGQSASYDMTNPAAREYFAEQMRGLQKEYGVDGFKFDGGDNYFYNRLKVKSFQPDALGTDHSRGWAMLGLEFPFNEYRTCWQMGNQPLVQRLGDKAFSWGDLAKLVPDMAAAGLVGYSYTCPDMIGGGSIGSFTGDYTIDQELVVRSAQVHAMMPMMQFSVAPWRILDAVHLEAVKQAAALHARFAPYIMECAREAAAGGEPIVQHMEYAFPGEGFETCRDQYMLGERYLVAPIVAAAAGTAVEISGAVAVAAARTVRLPRGRWRDDQGKVWKGGRTISVTAPLHRVPYFEKMK